MSEMVDRVAKAIAEAHDEFFDYDVLARAAIEAMREPSQPMVNAGALMLESEHAKAAAHGTYWTMIDTALKD